MSQNLTIQEFRIVLAAENHNPTILNSDFLRYSGIIPMDWELIRPPVYTNQVVQLVFQNGVSITAQQNQVIFSEFIDGKEIGEIEIPGIASKYVEILSNVDYQAIGFSPRGHVIFEQAQSTPHQYITQRLLSPGAWQEFGQAPAKATVNFTYALERGLLNLAITEAALRLPDETTVPVVLFSGTFEYGVTPSTKAERLQELNGLLNNWQSELKTFNELIEGKFLAQTQELSGVLPGLFAMSANS